MTIEESIATAKETIEEFELDPSGKIMQDANGQEIIVGYIRFFPSEYSIETFLAIFFIILGIFTILSLVWYQHLKTPKNG